MDFQNYGAAPERVDFSKIRTSIPIPNLIEVQKKSYERFLQMDLLPNEREDTGLQTVFSSVFPISDFRGVSELEFVDYAIGNWECKCGNLKGLHHLRSTCRNCGATIRTDPFHSGDVLCHHCGTFNKNVVTFCNKCGDPVGLQLKYDVVECQERGMTYAAPLKRTIRLTVYSKDPETGKKSVRDIKEQEVFFGEIPLMTDNGTFIINGTERVIVSQLHRSPGVFFKRGAIYIAKIIPYRGSWVEFEYDQKNLLYVRVGKRKFLASMFLRSLGVWLGSNFKIKSVAGDGQLEDAVKTAVFSDEHLLRAFYVVDEVRVDDGRLMVQVPESGPTHLVGMKVDFEIKGRGPDPIVRKGKEITRSSLEGLRKANIGEIEIEATQFEGAYAVADVVNTETGEVILEANNEINVAKLQEIAESGVQGFSIFFPERDDTGVVISQTLKKDTISKPVDALLEIYRKMRPGDPPTVQTAYRLLEGMFFDPRKFDFSRVGRLKFNIKMGNQEMQTTMPRDLINAKPVTAAVREFFGSSQLSQFMDQTNPLSEITHKRRLSALGPGGLSRERAGFEVRDVHPTHYGRICPIETPEGPNIGLISSLSCYARINEFGFIESPYRKVVTGNVVEFVRIRNAGGNTKYKVGDIVEATDVGADKDKVGEPGAGGRRRRGLEYEPYSYYLSAW